MSIRREKDGGLAATPGFEELKRLMECPVCCEIPSPPIYTCQTGHAICEGCKPKLKNCVVCKTIYTNTRNFPLESMITAAKFFCAHRPYGCETEGTSEELKEHHLVCPFRKLKCNWCISNDEVNPSQVFIQDFYRHLTADHKCVKLEVSVNEGKGSFSDTLYMYEQEYSSAIRYQPKVFIFDGKQFVISWSKTKTTMNCGIYLIDDDATATRYCARIAIRAPGNEYIPHYEMSMIVPSIRETQNHHFVYDAALPVPFLKKLGQVYKNPGGLVWSPEYKFCKL